MGASGFTVGAPKKNRVFGAARARLKNRKNFEKFACGAWELGRGKIEKMPPRELAIIAIELVQRNGPLWSSAHWVNGEIQEWEGPGTRPPCEHRFRARRDWRGLWVGRASCIYCHKPTRWKTAKANGAPNGR